MSIPLTVQVTEEEGGVTLYSILTLFFVERTPAEYAELLRSRREDVDSKPKMG